MADTFQKFKETAYRKIQMDLNDTPYFEICMDLFNFLTSERANRLNHITLGTLHRELKSREYSQQETSRIVSAATYLSGARVHLLNIKFQLIDEETDEVFPVENDVLHEANLSGRFFHPETGEEVPDYKSKIYPFFEPSEELSALHER